MGSCSTGAASLICDTCDELTDQLCGVVLTHLSGMAARCAPRGDLTTRRNIERVVFEVRTEMANTAQRKAAEAGEPDDVLDGTGTIA